MEAKLSALFALALASLSGCASVPPKVLVGQSFHGEDKNVEALLQDSGQTNPNGGQKLYSVLVRVCDVNETTATNNCKDSTVLTNVVPQSIY